MPSGLFDDILQPQPGARRAPAPGLFDDVLIGAAGQEVGPAELQIIDPTIPESLALRPATREAPAVAAPGWLQGSWIPIENDPLLVGDTVDPWGVPVQGARTSAPAVAPPVERPGFLQVLGDAFRRGGASSIAGTLHSGADLIDQTVGEAIRQVAAPLGLGGAFDDALGAADLARTALFAEQEINADRAAAAQAIGGRPTLGEAVADPLRAARQYGLHLANIAGELLPVMAAIATGNPELGAGALGALTGAQEYTDLRGEGVGRGEAAQAGVLSGAIEAAGEAFGLPAVLGRGGRGSLLRAMLSEGAQEAPVQLGQQVVEDNALGQQTPVSQMLGDALDAFLVGSGVGAGGHGLSVATDRLAGRGEPPAAPAPRRGEDRPLGGALRPEDIAATRALGDLPPPTRATTAAPAAPVAPVAARPSAQASPLGSDLPVEDAGDLDALIAQRVRPLGEAPTQAPAETDFAQQVEAARRARAEAPPARTQTAPAVAAPTGQPAPAPVGGSLSPDKPANEGAAEKVTLRRPEARGGDVQVEATRVGDRLVIPNGERWSVIRSESDGTYQVESSEPGESPQDAVARFERRAEAGRQVQAERQQREASRTGDPVRDALADIAAGDHPERVLERADEATVRGVAQRMGYRPRKGQSLAGIVEGIAGRPRSEWIAQARTALEGEPVESASEIALADLSPAERAAVDRGYGALARQRLAPQLAREHGEADADANGLREAVQATVGGSGVPVHFIRGLAGLPAGIRSDIESRNAGRKVRTAALYDPHGKQVFVLTDTVTDPQRAAWHAAHEIAGHHGLRALVRDRAGLDSALDLALQNPAVAKVAGAIAKERKSDDRRLMAEEALAELAAAARTGNYDEIASRYGVQVPQAQRATLRGAIARFVERLRKLLGKAAAFSDADVHALLENAWSAARKPSAKADAAVAENTEADDQQARMDQALQDAGILESVEDAHGRAEQRRNVAAATLPVSRGTAGWNYDTGAWEGRQGALNTARAHLQDKMLAWHDVLQQIESQLQAAIPDAQNVYQLENLMHGRVGEAMDRLERDQIKPLVDAMRAAKVEPATLEEYLYARHAKERNAAIAKINPAMPDGGSGMTNAEADAILAKADRAKLEPLARRVDGIVRANRRRMLANGLITQEAFDAMEAQYQHYVPLRGKATKETEFDLRGGIAGRGVDSRGKLVRNALGRGAGNRAQHILGEVIGDAQRTIIMAEKARVGRGVMRLVLANPNPALWEVEPVQTERALDADGEVYERVVNDWSDPSVIAVRHRGQLYRVRINSEPLATALNHVGVDKIGAATRVAGAVNRYFSAILTKYNPAFTPVNATRDAIFGLTGMAAEHGEAAALDAALHYPQAARAAFRHARGKAGDSQWDRWAREFAERGGKTGYVNAPSAEDIARKIGSGKLTGYSPEGLARAGRAIGDAIGVLNDAVENALRLSAYVTLRKRGATPDAAAAYAKDLTVNFNRKGFDGSKLNAWFLFYNASLQGAHRVGTILRKPKTWAYLGTLAAAQVIATLAAMGMEDDNGDPLWNQVPDHVKRRNLVVVLPDGGLVTIPMPYGFNLFPYMAGRITEAVANGERGEARAQDHAAALAADAISASIESFSPVPLDDGVFGLLPTPLRIAANVSANRNDFGRPIRREDGFGRSAVPRASMGRPDTLEVFKLTATGLNRLGGGDDYTPPPLTAFDVAPEDLEYLWDTLTGGPGRLASQIATTGQKLVEGVDLTARDVPIANRFVSAIDEQAAQAALYYQRREVIDRALKRVRAVYREEGAAAAERLLRATPELRGAAFRRRKRDTENGRAGDIIESNGGPQLIVTDWNSVYGAYKAAEEAIEARNADVEAAYAKAPATLVPNRERDAKLRAADKARREAQARLNAAWVRDVVGAVE